MKVKLLVEDYLSFSSQGKSRVERDELNRVALANEANALMSGLLQMYEADYEKAGGSLSLQWSMENGFAWAAAEDANEPIHSVNMTEVYLTRVSCNSLAVALHVIEGMDSEEVEESLKNKGIERRDHGYLYPGLNPVRFRYLLRNNALLLITAHELAHLLQFHSLFRNKENYAPYIGPLRMHMVNKEDDKELTGEMAEINHVTELAADYEAVVKMILYYANAKRQAFEQGLVSERGIAKKDVWGIVVAMFCMFMDFQVHPGDPFTGEVKGKHPYPAIRYKLATRTLFRYLRVNFSDLCEGEITANDVEELYADASWVGIHFWSERYENDRALDNFVKVIMEKDSPEIIKYFSAIVPKWDEVRPVIAKYYPENHYLMEFDVQARRHSGTNPPSEN